jgi:hypothetical protein
MEDSFNVICEDWVDEGSRDTRMLSTDEKANEPLVYLYEVVTKSNASGVIEETVNEIYSGGLLYHVYIFIIQNFSSCYL